MQDEYVSPIDSFQMPQVMTDSIMTFLTGDEFKVLAYLTRFATGFPQKTSLSISDIAEVVRLEKINSALSGLSKFGIVEQLPDGAFSIRWDTGIDWAGLNARYEAGLV